MPTLIHHDVHAGSILIVQKDDGWHLSGLVDPVGLQYADVERELAFMEAFDTVGPAFFEAYTCRSLLRLAPVVLGLLAALVGLP